MSTITFCDLCEDALPDDDPDPWGTIQFGQAVPDDMCQGCAKRVKEFIDRMKAMKGQVIPCAASSTRS